jgi:hypothetical protein
MGALMEVAIADGWVAGALSGIQQPTISTAPLIAVMANALFRI